MSDHAQALMLSTKVHAVFGYTLMLAGLARLIEFCFVAPSYAPATAVDGVEDDRSSDHTLADGAALASGAESKGRAFRHLPPFVSVIVVINLVLIWFSLPGRTLIFVFVGSAFDRSRITVHVRDRRRTAIRARRRHGPRHVHSH